MGQTSDLPFAGTYDEYAGYLNLTYHFTDQFDVQLGGRDEHSRQVYEQNFTGLAVGPPGPDYHLTTRSNDGSFTYLVTPRFRLSDSVMAYARVASGYQSGGPNTPFTPNSPIHSTFAPSTTVNYELGIKSRLFNRRLSIDADIYYIDWSKIQLVGITPQITSYLFNGGRAKSQGLEIAAEFKPIDNLTLGAAAAYTDAKLTSNAGHGSPGVAGDPLPFSSKLNGSVSIEDLFSVSHSVNGFVGATTSYVGARNEGFGFPTGPGQPQARIPSYAYANLRAGVATKGYSVTAFAKNVTNERGVLNIIQYSGDTSTTGVWRTAIITPRTIGISMSKEF